MIANLTKKKKKKKRSQRREIEGGVMMLAQAKLIIMPQLAYKFLLSTLVTTCRNRLGARKPVIKSIESTEMEYDQSVVISAEFSGGSIYLKFL